MQQSSQALFCEECGLANDAAASRCAACQHPLNAASSVPDAPLPVPVTVTPPPGLAVTPGPLAAPDGSGISSGTGGSSAPRSFQPGSILAGRYQIEAEIGHGGFSTVYRAIDLRDNFPRHRVAIKRIQLSQLTPRQIIDATETFNREVFLLSELAQINGISSYREHLTDSENWYLITTYIRGKTLEEHLRKARRGYLKENEVLALGIEVALTLKSLHAHEPTIIFRDVKPANIMLTPMRSVFLIDFGIARVFTPGKAKDTTPLGSPGYAPPEQYGRAQTDPCADIYSLGATLQTLLTGREPLELHDGEPSRNPKPPHPALQQLLNEMLAPDPAQRPPDMATVQARLEAILYRPSVSFVSGLLLAFVFCITSALFSPLTSLPFFRYFSFITCIISISVSIPFLLFVRKMNPFPPKGFRKFWWLGLLTVIVAIMAIATLWQNMPKIW